jgi:hypothetical protein
MQEYVPDFDIKVSIGVEKPTDRQYWVNLAFQMFQTIDPSTQMPLIDAQAVQYVIQEGRMEPMSVIENRMQSEQKQMQMIQQLQQKVQQDEQEIEVLNHMVQQFTGHVQDSQGQLQDAHSQNMQSTNDTLQTLEQGQQSDRDHQIKLAQHQQGLNQQAHQQQMDKGKLLIEAAKLHQAGQKQAVGDSVKNSNSKIR